MTKAEQESLQALAVRVLNLNPNCREIGAGMLAQMQDEARRGLGLAGEGK